MKLEGLSPLFQVFDMPTSIRFYRDVLGFTVVSTSPSRGPDDCDWCLLERDGILLMLNTAYDPGSRPPTPDPPRVAAHQDASLYFGCRDVDGAYAELRDKGLEVEPPTVAPYGMKQLYLRDPDGYIICLQWTVPATA